MKILKSNPISTYIDVEEISKPIIVDKRTKKSKKQALHMDIIPSYQTRQFPLGENSIQNYISKANTINIIFKNRKLPQNQFKQNLKNCLMIIQILILT
jgi:hypothetical protein